MINQRQMMKQVQKMQEKMEKLQEELAQEKVEGQAGGGKVIVTFNGQQEIESVKIDKTVIDPEEVELLEDLITVAVRDALAKTKELNAQKLGQLTGGIRIPGLF